MAPFRSGLARRAAAPAAAPPSLRAASNSRPSAGQDFAGGEQGDAAAGQLICIIEAMKMENEVLCPRDGTIAAVQSAPAPMSRPVPDRRFTDREWD